VTERPAYDPRDLQRLYLLGYRNIFMAIATKCDRRRLERECSRGVEDCAILLAMSRASSWMERGIFLAGSFRQQRGLKGQAPQSHLLAEAADIERAS
jgi:hypothetical protein